MGNPLLDTSIKVKISNSAYFSRTLCTILGNIFLGNVYIPRFSKILALLQAPDSLLSGNTCFV